MQAELLIQHIANNFHGNQSAFARAHGMPPAQISKWCRNGYIIADGTIYRPTKVIFNVNAAIKKRG